MSSHELSAVSVSVSVSTPLPYSSRERERERERERKTARIDTVEHASTVIKALRSSSHSQRVFQRAPLVDNYLLSSLESFNAVVRATRLEREREREIQDRIASHKPGFDYSSNSSVEKMAQSSVASVMSQSRSASLLASTVVPTGDRERETERDRQKVFNGTISSRTRALNGTMQRERERKREQEDSEDDIDFSSDEYDEEREREKDAQINRSVGSPNKSNTSLYDESEETDWSSDEERDRERNEEKHRRGRERERREREDDDSCGLLEGDSDDEDMRELMAGFVAPSRAIGREREKGERERENDVLLVEGVFGSGKSYLLAAVCVLIKRLSAHHSVQQ